MKTENVKAIPYGLSNYERLVETNCYFVDKTMYMETLEKSGDYLFFIRPRRFGKSLFISLMETYYDVYYRDRFEELFKGTAIYERPTKERGAYLVLKFNFSLVNPAPEKVETSFLHHVRSGSLLFLEKYASYLKKGGDYFKKTIEESDSASDILSSLSDLCRMSRQKLYVIIDEYDNFANTILSTTGKNAYQNLTRGAGAFRAFFNVLKGGTDGTGAPFTRLLLTGVSPITLDDVTSGYNIGENVSLDAAFNRMLGFTRHDTLEMLNYYKTAGLIKHDTGNLLEIVDQWYGNYLFSKHSTNEEKIYNPDMVLYFIKQYFKTQSLPDDLIDRNVRIDYGKLRHLIIVDKEKSKSINGNFSKLKEIVENGETSAKIEKGFPLEELPTSDNFVSLLFYFGLLTIAGTGIDKDKIRLRIPNETMKRLYYDYILKGYKETGILELDLSRYSELMADMAFDGKWRALFDYITGRMSESMSLRDLITGEKSIQAFLNVYLGLSNLFIIHAEKELNMGYADIVMEPFLARYQEMKYSYLLEIKYIKIKQKSQDKGKSPEKLEKKIKRLKAEAETQLNSYSIDKKFRKNIDKTTLIKLVLIFHGHELIDIAAVD
ncbi:MAG: AAA family ATPase [bacterium]|nr:AAA family ATPase [bacterium]